MITDLRDLETEQTFNADVCIVGAGPAGVTMALEFERQGITTLLVESGGLGYEDQTQDLYAGELKGHQNTDLTYSRLRQFGGSTGHWTGMCAPLDPIDFEARACNGNISWPFGRADLDPFYARAHSYLELGEFNYDVEQWDPELSGEALALPSSLIKNSAYQLSPPTRFGEKYPDAIEAAANVRCLLHANLTDITLNEASSAVEQITLQALNGVTATVRANRFVLACGGIENARLLLNADRQRQGGLGNENDLVGRYFMDHLNIETSRIMLSSQVGDVDYYEQATDTTNLIIGLKVAEDLMRQEDLLNNTAFFGVVWKDAAHNDDFRDHAWLSFSALARSFARGSFPDRFAERSCNVLEAPQSVITGVSRHIQRRLSDGAEIDYISIRQDAEQAPNPNSRVSLEADRDSLGMRRVSLDWRVLESDMVSLQRSHEIIGQALGQSGVGRLQMGIEDTADFSNVFTGYHHMGTTRMHQDPRLGVVNADCRLHSVENLYIAGSSVFPTAGTANPTLTLTALSIRLADHLATKLTS